MSRKYFRRESNIVYGNFYYLIFINTNEVIYIRKEFEYIEYKIGYARRQLRALQDGQITGSASVGTKTETNVTNNMNTNKGNSS